MSILLGPIDINLYGIMIALGVLAAITIAYYEAKRRGDDTNHVFSIVLVVLPLGIIGARMYHVIDQWSYYSQHPSQIIGGAGLGIFGAVIGGAIGVLIYTKWRKIGTLHWLDIIAPGLILAQAIGRWGNFFNQELYGYPTSLPWGIYIRPENRLPGYEQYAHFQPLFFYEFMWDSLGCVLLLVAARKWAKKLLNGDVFLFYIMFYSVGRFYLEGLKLNAPTSSGLPAVWSIDGFPTARWITALAFVISLGIFIWRHTHRKKETPHAQIQN
jgi:phosphatidylglycerol:prolipoprotein diacylglycerol transferase